MKTESILPLVILAAILVAVILAYTKKKKVEKPTETQTDNTRPTYPRESEDFPKEK